MDFATYASDAIINSATSYIPPLVGTLAAGKYITSKRKSTMPTTSNTQLAKKNYRSIRRINRKVKDLHIELKRKDFALATSVPLLSAVVVDITEIAQGDNVNMRQGRKVRIAGVDITTHKENTLLDVHLVLAPQGIAPTLTSFYAVRGGKEVLNEKDEIKILHTFRNENTSQSYFASLNRKLNIVAKYATTDFPICNSLYLVAINRSSSFSYNYDYMCKVYFHDS